RQRVLCVEESEAIEARTSGHRPDGQDPRHPSTLRRSLRRAEHPRRARGRSRYSRRSQAGGPADAGGGLKGLHPVKFVTTTVADPAADRALDKVDRQFNAEGPDRLWVADITYVPTWSGFLYLAIVLDVWSRRIVGWAMANHLKTELVLDALDM